MAPDKTSKHLLTTSELTCLLPIRTGFVADTLDTRTYATRLRIAMKLLHGLRTASRESAPFRPVLDSVEAIRGIHNFSFSVLQNRHVLMSVAFDSAWEPYIRTVWKGLGPVLDLVLCNCEGYDLPALEQGFDRFVGWIRERQVESEFFYATGRLTVDDERYLTDIDRLTRGGGPTMDEAIATHVAADPATLAERVRGEKPAPGAPPTAVARFAETSRQYAALLGALFGLRELYPRADERFLRSATATLMAGFDPDKHLTDAARYGLGREVDWVRGVLRPASAGPLSDRPDPPTSSYQGGIVEPYRRMTHGCLLLFSISDAAAATAFVQHLHDVVTTADQQGAGPSRSDCGPDTIVQNVAFSLNGLRRLGVSEGELAAFPSEFRDGMEARAGLLGDVRGNHPDNWTPPLVNWPLDSRAAGRVRLSTIDLVVTLRGRFTDDTSNAVDGFDADHPLYPRVADLAERPGVRLLSVEPMRRFVRPDTATLDAVEQLPREHFGFKDGISQPTTAAQPERERWHDTVPLGELLLGHRNRHDDPAFPPASGNPRPGRIEQGSLLDNGSFLVVRKLREHVETLDAVLAAPENAQHGTRRQLLAYMAGRDVDGVALAGGTPGTLNDFNYDGDNTGMVCPLTAHIRRANPRLRPEKRVPRIARRGMTYGPPPSAGAADRGVMFMAFNASIAEQFEVIQRWVTGGNSTGVFSDHADPFLHVPETGTSFVMRFPTATGVKRLNLGDQPLVSLAWGMYLFVPSMAALKRLAAAPVPDGRAATEQVGVGLQVIASLKTLDDWIAGLEDLSFNRSGMTAAIYAAIRHAHGGVLRTPYGVIAASKAAVDRVLGDDTVYSVGEYRQRMTRSVGEGYLGMDYGAEYHRRSQGPNAIVGAISRRDAFREALRLTTDTLGTLVPRRPAPLRLDMLVDISLARLCALWFGVPSGPIRAGGKPRDPLDPADPDVHLPYHSLAPSRYVFSSPNLRPSTEAIGQLHGQKLLNAVRTFVQAERTQAVHTIPPGPLRSLFESIADDDELARVIVGMVEGFLPTVFGNMLKVLNLWLAEEPKGLNPGPPEESFWRVQLALAAAGTAGDAFDTARTVVEPAMLRAMMARPVPEIVYRTAKQPAMLGTVAIVPGDKVVVAIGSATDELRQQPGAPDVSLVFGGLRAAPSHPTHACPAYEMGLGVMLGMLTAVLKAGEIVPTSMPLVVQAR